ncbi:hypothetical protein FE394_18135 [Xenorhabdus sp. Reich]|uniref:Transposase n=1 Tax=Xenorhabdus littoralis TaxID=2582835 RepID=A0ABU4SR68_9GAMM|nr:hypothetical protein [Xenorhabdus sp. Reich]MDX8001056.1 hypothetical protein [Xenorhabdus sp. Reich]
MNRCSRMVSLLRWKACKPPVALNGGKKDVFTDGTFQPLELDCTEKGVCSGFIEKGKVHKGFWEAFHLF